MKNNKRARVLTITPGLTGGGWISMCEPIMYMKNRFEFIVAGIGPVKHGSEGFKLYRLPYFDYTNVGLILSLNSLFSVLYQLPLAILALMLILIYRPKVLMSNGFCAALYVAPLAKVMGRKTVISYHGEIEHYSGKATKKIVRIFCKFVDKVLVNSEGSREDILPLVNPSKVKIVKHWADNCFFSVEDDYRINLRKEMGLSNRFVLLYVGAIDNEKLVPVLINVIENLSKHEDFNDFYFIFIGTGGLVNRIKELAKQHMNIKYLDYIGDRTELSNFYSIADIVWSFGDTTYLARPTIEALAAGTPVIIPDVPAIFRKAMQDFRIPHDIIPKEIGWIVCASDIAGISELLIKIKREKIANEMMRSSCRNYAKREHSENNMKIILDTLSEA